MAQIYRADNIEPENIILEPNELKDNKNSIPTNEVYNQHSPGDDGDIIKTISNPCKHKKDENCDCRTLSTEEFEKRVYYEAYKFNVQSNKFNKLTESCHRSNFYNNWKKVLPDSQTSLKFLIVIAMYNEQAEEFYNTLDGVLKNLKDFEGYVDIKDIGCIVIIDGIEPFMKTFNSIDGQKILEKNTFQKNKSYFSQFFNQEIIKNAFFGIDPLEKIKGKFKLMEELTESGLIEKNDEILHCFSQRIQDTSQKNSLNLMFCVKQLNKRKLNSHMWFFNVFCTDLNPKYTMMLDVGTIPKEKSLFYLYDAMEKDPNVAGCCGEIVPIRTFNFIVLTQITEYKFAHILDKALESLVGWVSVLPGAFSAYRWSNLSGNSEALRAYFKSQREPLEKLSEANMFLAEDRILCMELLCQKDKCNVLRYVKNSIAETDVPGNLNELMAQRRRWINGSWFATINSISDYNRIGESNHTKCRKFIFRMLLIYYTIAAAFSWILVGAFYLAFAISIKRNFNESSVYQNKLDKWSTPPIVLYVSVLISVIITSFSVKPKKIETFYRVISVILGIYSYATIALTFYFMFNKDIKVEISFTEQLSISLLAIGTFMIFLIILLNPTSIPSMLGSPIYIFFTGAYVNMFLIYSICNIHDVSWGNRPDKQTEDEKKQTVRFETERTRWVILWIISNGAFAYVVDVIDNGDGTNSRIYISCIALIAISIMALKFIGGLLYVIKEWHLNCCR